MAAPATPGAAGRGLASPILLCVGAVSRKPDAAGVVVPPAALVSLAIPVHYPATIARPVRRKACAGQVVAA